MTNDPTPNVQTEFANDVDHKSKPKEWKVTIIVWLAIYPTITLLSYLSSGLMVSFPLPMRTLVLTVIVVPLMVYLLIPFLNNLFAEWLKK